MNTPKLTRRSRDGIWRLEHYVRNIRKRKSLGTVSEIEARIIFIEITGFQHPPISPTAPLCFPYQKMTANRLSLLLPITPSLSLSTEWRMLGIISQRANVLIDQPLCVEP